MNHVDPLAKYTTIEYQYLDNGNTSTSKRVYHDSKGTIVNPPPGSLDENTLCIYKEAQFILANLGEKVSVSFFEQLSLSKKTCRIYVISPLACASQTNTCKGKTIKEAEHAALNLVAYEIETYCGNTLGCSSGYIDMLRPLAEGTD